MIEVISFAALVTGFGIYLVYWLFFSPRVFFRVGGEQKGEPIKILPVCSIPFAVSTNSCVRVNLLSVSVLFDDNFVSLFSTKGIKMEISVDRKFPMAALFLEEKIVARKILQANYLDIHARKANFSIKISVVAEADHASLPFFLSILPARKVRVERVVEFEVDSNIQMVEQTHGLMIKPGEAVQTTGIQAQDGVTAATNKGSAIVNLREIPMD